jgi:hypothetical protein
VIFFLLILLILLFISRRRQLILGAFFLSTGAHTASPATVIFQPVADTTLIETEPDNNLGGAPFVNAGITQNFTKNHGLFRFDIAGHIPSQSKITGAELILEVTHSPRDGFAPAEFGLHRLLVPWGEGNKIADDPTHPGLGAPATTNEATWNDRFAFTTNRWNVPGAAVTNDYSPVVTAQQTIYSLGDSPYAFESTSAMVADVQSWLDEPQTNFGWLLKTLSEVENFTARSFGSREDANHPPLLVVDFIPAPIIQQSEISGNQFKFLFTAHAGQTYQVEFRDSFSSNGWLTLTNIAAPVMTSDTLILDSLTNAQRFYRVVAQ